MADKKPIKKTSMFVADSWEDDEPDGETPIAYPAPNQTVVSTLPPTPMDPAFHTQQQQSSQASQKATNSSRARPEKTDAVARRMIAASLGLKAPKQTEEQKAYQKSIREQEKKRREQEKLDEKRHKEEVEKAKAAIWDD